MNEIAPTIHGERVTLRPLTHDDLSFVYHWMTDDELLSLVEVNYPVDYGFDDIRAIFDGALRREECILIIEDDLGQPVGDIWLHPIDFVHRHASTTLQLGERGSWGRGLATEALELVLRHAFEGLELHRVEAEILSTNARAIAFFERNGFFEEGVKRDYLLRSGNWFDVVMLAMLNPNSGNKRKV